MYSFFENFNKFFDKNLKFCHHNRLNDQYYRFQIVLGRFEKIDFFRNFGQNGMTFQILEGKIMNFDTLIFSKLYYFFLQKLKILCSGSQKRVVLSISNHFETIQKNRFLDIFLHLPIFHIMMYRTVGIPLTQCRRPNFELLF